MQKSVFTPEYALLRSELRSARERAGLSQRDLAQKLGVPHSWVAKVESGERRLDVIETCRFLCACGADVMSVLQTVAHRCVQPRRRGR